MTVTTREEGSVTDRDQSRDTLDRLTVAEAADRLGITEAGVRKRVQRGQIPHDRDDRGRVWVWLSPDETRRDEPRDRDSKSRDERYIRSLEDQVRYLREKLDEERQARTEERQRHDMMMAQLTSRIPELAPPTAEETRGAPESATVEAERAEPHPATPGPQEGRERPWWRRIFPTS